jgi:pimeloyl-ACP methyl ester carboxylesterase
MHTVLIHGLNSSSRSFAWLGPRLPGDVVAVDYRSHQPLAKSVAQVRRQLPAGPLVLVGHSLGGVIALTLARELGPDRVHAVATVSSPVAGSRAASALSWMPGAPAVLSDISPSAPAIRALRAGAPCPVLSVVSTSGGLPTTPEPNDSVVTVASQAACPGARLVRVRANHFEVLMADETAAALARFTSAARERWSLGVT